jgi:ribokinase
MARTASPWPSVSERHQSAEGGKTGRVIVIGSVNVDLVVVTDRLPGAGETVTGGTFARHHGGKGGNQAVAASRLGAATSFVGATGDDAFGAEARAALQAENVDTTHLGTAAMPTGVALIVVARGENIIAVASGANRSVTAEAVRSALESLAAKPGDVVLVSHEIPTAAATEALRFARSAGATTILNPAPADGLDRATLALADVITPNRAEVAALANADAKRAGRYRVPLDGIAAARSLIEASPEGQGPRAILVSLGAGGAVLVRPGKPDVEIAAPQLPAVDSTGAGDTLNGALGAALAGGKELEVAAREAVIAASLSVSRAGAREGMPTRTELEAVLRA